MILKKKTIKPKKYFLYLPLMLLFILYFVSLFIIFSNSSKEIITFEEILFSDSVYSLAFSALLTISLISFLAVRMFVKRALKNPIPKNLMTAIVITELPLICGFIISFSTVNLIAFAPFTLLFAIYYVYMYRKISPLFL